MRRNFDGEFFKIDSCEEFHTPTFGSRYADFSKKIDEILC